MDLARAREEYLSYLAVERGSSRNTLDAYGRDLARYGAWLAERGVTQPDDVTLPLIERYVAELSEAGLAASSVERAASAVKGFHRFMLADEIARTLPTADLPLPAKPERLPDVISREDAARLPDQPFPATPAGLRDHAVLEVLYGCGLRASELVGLDERAVLLDEGLLRVFGKGSKERVVPVMGAAARALAAYLERGRGALAGRRPCAAVFLNVRGGRLSRQSVHAIVEKYGGSWGSPACTRTRCATALPRTCWRAGLTCAWYRSCSGMPTWPPRSSTRTSTAATSVGSTWTRTRARDGSGRRGAGGAEGASRNPGGSSAAGPPAAAGRVHPSAKQGFA